MFEIGREAAHTKIGKVQLKKIRTKCAGRKNRLTFCETANVFDPKTRKYSNMKIKTITDSPANRHFIRRNIITKGCIIETEAGKARVTSRPGQHGAVNAVLI